MCFHAAGINDLFDGMCADDIVDALLGDRVEADDAAVERLAEHVVLHVCRVVVNLKNVL